MTDQDPPDFSPNAGRAFLKSIVVICGVLALAAILALTLRHDAVNDLKFNLSLTSLITLVVIINLVSFACFMTLYAAYQWVRRDLKCPRLEDHPDKDI